MSKKILADENIPFPIIHSLRKSGIEVSSIFELSPGITDLEIIKIAQNKKAVILTFDKDFGELIYSKNYYVEGIILLRITPKSPEYILEKIMKVILIMEYDMENNFIVVDDNKVRIKKINPLS